MKFKNKYTWNVERKAKKYWISLILLLFPCMFEFSLFNGPILFIYERININIERFDHNLIMLRQLNFISMIGLIILFILGLQICLSMVKGKVDNGRTSVSLYSFIYYPQFKADVFTLIVIIFAEIYGYYQIIDLIGPESIIFVFFSILTLLGIYINLSCIFPWGKYNKVQNSLKEQTGIFQEAWFCVPKHSTISTFSILPGECKEIPIVITENELSIINKRKNCRVRDIDFNKLLIYLDETINEEEFRYIIEKYSTYLHMRCLIVSKVEIQDNQYEKEINILKERLDAQFIYIFQNIHSLNRLDKYLGIKYTYNVVKCLKEKNTLQNMGSLLVDNYLNIVYGPTVSVKFFKACLTEPNLSKAIYQLFDYIDLQYRLACAFFAPSNLTWYIKKSSEIGNIRHMFQFLAGNLKDLTTKTEIETQYILDNDMWAILEKYLPNYAKSLQSSQKLNSEDIKELCSDLRIRLRAHQDMELIDVPTLLNLVFRIAIATNYMLGINQMVINCEPNRNIRGNYKNISNKPLAPFLKLDQGYIWIFNNARRDNNCFQIEYINFLTGKLKRINT